MVLTYFSSKTSDLKGMVENSESVETMMDTGKVEEDETTKVDIEAEVTTQINTEDETSSVNQAGQEQEENETKKPESKVNEICDKKEQEARDEERREEDTVDLDSRFSQQKEEIIGNQEEEKAAPNWDKGHKEDEIENDTGICEDETAKKDEVGEFYSQPTSPLSSSLSLSSGTNSPDLSITLNETEYVEEDILFYEVKDRDELEDYAGEEMENTREEKEKTREEKENTREEKENTREEKENPREEMENTREEKDDTMDVWSLEDWQDCCSGSQGTDTTSLVEQVVEEEHMMDPPENIVNKVVEIGEKKVAIEEKDKEKEEKDKIQTEKDKINEEKDKIQEEKDKIQEEKEMGFDGIVAVDEQESPDDWEDKKAQKQEVTWKFDKELHDVNIEMVALSKVKNDKNLQDALEEVVVIADEKTKTLVLDKNSERLMNFFRAQTWPLLAKIGSMLCAWLFLLVVLWAFGSFG